MRRLLLLAPLALILAACANGAPDAPAVNGGNTIPGAPGYWVVRLQYEGYPLNCVKMMRGKGSDRYGGLACDFREFHHRFGWHPRYYSSGDGGIGG